MLAAQAQVGASTPTTSSAASPSTSSSTQSSTTSTTTTATSVSQTNSSESLGASQLCAVGVLLWGAAAARAEHPAGSSFHLEWDVFKVQYLIHENIAWVLLLVFFPDLEELE